MDGGQQKKKERKGKGYSGNHQSNMFLSSELRESKIFDSEDANLEW